MLKRRLDQVLRRYAALERANEWGGYREACKTDLFFLLTVGCRRVDLKHQWFLDRCDEVQCEPDGHLDLWSREHGKSSILTFGKTLQDILVNPELTIGIFSHTRPMAKAFLRTLKRELESNEFLKSIFPEILWPDPEKDAPTWSEDSGIVVRRRGNPKEATVEAWGLVEGMPTGKHFDILVFDDIVTKDNAASPEMREKTLEAWKHALNLGKRGGRRRMAGTRYHFGDAYGAIIEQKSATPRVYPALPIIGIHPESQTPIYGDEPVLLTHEELDAKRNDMGPYVFASQMMLNPRQDTEVGFKLGWLRTYHGDADGNTYVIVDPANEKKKKSDYTAIFVVTASADRNWYVRWFKRDRLNLVERTNLVFWAHREFAPLRIGYEEYGMQADIQHIQDTQNREKYRFDIVPLGGKLGKFERIHSLIPTFEQGRVYMPPTLFVPILDRGGEICDMMDEFTRNEFTAWPYAVHDDMLDALARINDPDLGVTWPRPTDTYRARMPTRRRVARETVGWVA